MWPLTVIGLLIWAGGSLAFVALMPWRSLDREDRWLMWAVVFGWPVILAWAIVELLFEQFMPRKPWWMRGGGP